MFNLGVLVCKVVSKISPTTNNVKGVIIPFTNPSLSINRPYKTVNTAAKTIAGAIIKT